MRARGGGGGVILLGRMTLAVSAKNQTCFWLCFFLVYACFMYAMVWEANFISGMPQRATAQQSIIVQPVRAQLTGTYHRQNGQSLGRTKTIQHIQHNTL